MNIQEYIYIYKYVHMYTQACLYTLYIDIRYIKWYTYIKMLGVNFDNFTARRSSLTFYL